MISCSLTVFILIARKKHWSLHFEKHNLDSFKQVIFSWLHFNSISNCNIVVNDNSFYLNQVNPYVCAYL